MDIEVDILATSPETPKIHTLRLTDEDVTKALEDRPRLLLKRRSVEEQRAQAIFGLLVLYGSGADTCLSLDYERIESNLEARVSSGGMGGGGSSGTVYGHSATATSVKDDHWCDLEGEESLTDITRGQSSGDGYAPDSDSEDRRGYQKLGDKEDEAALEVEDIEDTLDSDAGSDPGDGVPASTSSTLHTLGHRVGRSTITTSGGGGGGGIIGSGGIAAPRATITRTNPLFAHGGVEGDSGAWSAPGVSGSSAVSPVRSLPPIAGRRVPVTVLPGSVGLPPKRTKPSRWWLDDDQDPELGIEERKEGDPVQEGELGSASNPFP